MGRSDEESGGPSVAFDLFVSAFGGTVGTLMAALVAVTGDLTWPGYYLVAAGVVGAVCVALLRESARRPLPGSPPSVTEDEVGDRRVAARE